MRNPFLFLGATLILSLPGLVVAQNPPASGLTKVDDDRTDLTWQGRSIDKIEDMDLYNAAGNKIGEVEGVLADANNQISAVIVEYGGTLGVGEKEVVVPLDRLQANQEDRFVTELTEADLDALPAWKD